MIARKRNYVVLVKGADGRWMQFSAAYASGRQAAIDQATASGSVTSGTFRAVTAKAWGREYTR